MMDFEIWKQRRAGVGLPRGDAIVYEGARAVGATFGTTWEVTTVETRIECMDPPDDATRAHRRALAEAAE